MVIKTVLFDLDDTLYLRFADCHQAGMEAMGAFAEKTISVPSHTFQKTFLEARREVYSTLPCQASCHDRTLHAQRALEMLQINPIPYAQTLFQLYWQAALDQMVMDPATPELLRELHRRGIRIGVVTDMTADIQMQKLLRLGIAELVDVFVASEEVGLDKPAPPIYFRALQKAGCSSAEAIFVGDTFSHDILGALDCGIRPVWVNVRQEPRPSEWKPQVIETRNMQETAAVLRELTE